MKPPTLSHCAVVPRRLKQLTLTAAAALALALAPAASAAAPPLVDTGISGYPSAMNQSGQFVGNGETSPGSGVYQGFFVDPATGSVQFLPAFGTDSVYPDAINDSGLVLGSYSPGVFDVYGGPIYHAFVWSAAAGYRDIGPAGAGCRALAMNNAGQVAGYFYRPDGSSHAFFWDGTTFTDLGALGGDYSYATAINIHGQVVGYTSLADGSSSAFIWDAANGMQQINAGSPEIITDAGMVGGVTWGPGNGIHVWDAVNGATFYANPDTSSFGGVASPRLRAVTPSRQAIVTFENPFTGDRSYVMDPVLGAQELLLPGGSRTSVSQVNKGGQAAGTFVTATGETHAFVWDAAHGMQDLGTLPGGSSSLAHGISDSGQVTGEANTATGETHAFLWDAANGMQDLGTLGGTYSTGQLIGNGAVAGNANTTGDAAQNVFYAKLSAGAPDLQVSSLTVAYATKDNCKHDSKCKHDDKCKCKHDDKCKCKHDDKCDKHGKKFNDDDDKDAKSATISVVVSNTGTAAAGATTTRVFDGSKLLVTFATPALAAGQSDTVNLIWSLKKVEDGKHTLKAVADAANVVTESNETNNTNTVTIRVGDSDDKDKGRDRDRD